MSTLTRAGAGPVVPAPRAPGAVFGFGVEAAALQAADGEDQQTLRAAADLTRVLTGMAHVAVVLVERAGETLLLHSSKGSSAAGMDRLIDVLFPAVLRPDGMALCEDVRGLPGLPRSPGDSRVLDEHGDEVRSCLGASLLVDGVRVGRVVAYDSRPRVVTAEHVTGLRGVAELMAAVLRARRDHRVTEQMAEDLRRTSAELVAAESFTRALLDALPVGVAACDAEGRFTTSNQVTRDWTSTVRGAGAGEPASVLADPDTWGTPSNVLGRDARTPLRGPETPLAVALLEGGVDGVELVLTHPEEADRTVSCSGRAFRSPAGEVLGAVVVMTDVTETRRLELELRQAAMHDPLTELPNRRLFDEALAHVCRGHAQVGAPVALLYCDLDGFKSINDDLGHEAGDAVLAITASRMVAAVRPQDMVARLGGDEFAVLLSDARPEEVAAIARRLEDAVSAPIRLPSGTTVVIGVSVGSAHRGRDESPASLLQAADRAMYEVKSRHR